MDGSSHINPARLAMMQNSSRGQTEFDHFASRGGGRDRGRGGRGGRGSHVDRDGGNRRGGRRNGTVSSGANGGALGGNREFGGKLVFGDDQALPTDTPTPNAIHNVSRKRRWGEEEDDQLSVPVGFSLQ
jgi:hypothetical protein